MTDNPLISVLIPSYNHAAFIEAAVNSVLAQTYRNIQIVIVDDASSDASPQLIRSFGDERIVFRLLAANVGACEAMNIGISICEGDFIAVCNSDDLWIPEKLEQQIKRFRGSKNLGAVFSDVEWIDDFGRPLTRKQASAFHDVFRQANRSRFAWMKDLIEKGNSLCHPSILIRREVYDRVGTYNNFYRQLPDLDMWLRVLQHYDIFIMPEKLVHFRIHDSNTSRPSPTTSNRSINEHRLLLRSFLRDISPENFYAAFGFTSLAPRDDANSLKYEIAQYLLNHRGSVVFEGMFNQLGTELLLELPPREIVERGMSAHAFHQFVGRNSAWIGTSGSSGDEYASAFGQRLTPTVAETRTVDLVKTVIRRVRSRLKAR
ncbi:MAG: glycosyltransferase [Pseudorhizobium sp.]